MSRRARFAMLGSVAWLAGCSLREFKDCEVSCTPASGCPSSMSCSAEGYCRAAGATQTCPQIVGDAGLGGPRDGLDADPSCACSGPTSLTCASGTRSCDLGCVASGGSATCRQIVASNAVPLDAISVVTTDIILLGGATFNTTTGAITGALTRAPGEGLHDGIAFIHLSTPSPIGVFTFHRLTVASSATISFSGRDAAAFVSASSVTIGGTIDGTGASDGGGGPGGGLGAFDSSHHATGCGPGGDGSRTTGFAGGGGGGGRTTGGAGGTVNNVFGAPGAACLAATAEPLIGGGGGGGAAGIDGGDVFKAGGGGGGALQITAITEIAIAGTIDVGGGGGQGGLGGNATQEGGGGGAGAGGAILLEAPNLRVSGVLAANGGGGGGGGYFSAGGTGQQGTATATAAQGGSAGGASPYAGAGGAGGAAVAAPGPGASSTHDGGGGGGAAGVIYLRGQAAPVLSSSIISPPAETGSLRTNP